MSFCKSLNRYLRRPAGEVKVGMISIGGQNPIVVQTMTNTDTNDTEKCVEQINSIKQKGGQLIRLTTQGVREAENLKNIKDRVSGVALVADVHFLPKVALIAAEYADKVRINPGNYKDADGKLFKALIEKCRKNGVAIRIGVNHGSLSERIVNQYGDTPLGMVASAMEFLRVCVAEEFNNVVVSIKSSNVRVMVQAYRLLVEAMSGEKMNFALHLGVTEAGNSSEGRIKSAVGIGALLNDGIGDTIRVSLTEDPANEIPVAKRVVDHYVGRENHAPIAEIIDPKRYSPTEYLRRKTVAVGRVGGENIPLLYNELNQQELQAIQEEKIVLLRCSNENAPAWWRSEILNSCDERPVIIAKKYSCKDLEALQIAAAADMGMLFLDGLADGLWIECEGIDQKEIDDLALNILQSSRVRISKTEYIACPGCGRTLYDLEGTLAKIKERTAHLVGLKIGVMGCIVNGPGEMADADYGYVGSGRGLVTLYKGKVPVKKSIPQQEAIDELLKIIEN